MTTALENILTTTHKADMIAYVHSHPACFNELIKLAISDKQPYSWRAAWLLWSCISVNDKRVRNHIKKMIDVLPQLKLNQQREILKVLYEMHIEENFEGELFNHCISLWQNISAQPSVRMNAFKMLIKVAKRHPELVPEIMALSEDHYLETLSPGVKHSLNKILKTLEQKRINVT